MTIKAGQQSLWAPREARERIETPAVDANQPITIFEPAPICSAPIRLAVDQDSNIVPGLIVPELEPQLRSR